MKPSERDFLFYAVYGKPYDDAEIVDRRDELWERIETRLSERLTERERLIVSRRAEGRLFREIGDEVGVSIEGVRKIYERSLKFLRRPTVGYRNPARK